MLEQQKNNQENMLTNKQEHAHENYTTPPIFSIQGLFSFAGRRSRLPYFLLTFLFYMILDAGGKLLQSHKLLLGTFICIASSIFLLTNIVKRFHDLGKNKWYGIAFFFIGFVGGLFEQLSFLTFIINIIPGLYLLFFKGEKGPNKYGPDPLGANIFGENS